MELMRPLLLFALAAFLPQALGKSQIMRPENSLYQNKNTDSQNKSIAINTSNKFSAIRKVSDLQSVFMDPNCKECHKCMEQVIKAHKIHFHVKTERKVNDVSNIIENDEENTTQRKKRNLDVDANTKIGRIESKKSKAKKNKSVSVIKYNDDNDNVYALKIKEAITPLLTKHNSSQPVTKCQIYKVNLASSCDSPDADKILHEMKPKVKKQAKEQEKIVTISPFEKQEELKNSIPLIIKHHVEDSHMLESFKPSVEEMY